MSRVGVFGGTFDPPHLGHLAAARACVRSLELDKVIWIPNGTPPHKSVEVVSPAEVRLEMTRAAVAGEERFTVSDVEMIRAGPSYTVDTLRQLRASMSVEEMFLILGYDQLDALHTWRGAEEIAVLADIAAVPRNSRLTRLRSATGPGSRLGELHVRSVHVPFQPIDLSSRSVRAARAASGDLGGVVPGVAGIIERLGLYRSCLPSDPLGQDELEAWGRELGYLVEPPHFIALKGRIGAGKSVLARALGTGLGVNAKMPSPTFSIVHRYPTAEGAELVHLDLYRVESPDDLWELGWEELGRNHEIVLLEWPEGAAGLMPADHWSIELISVGDAEGARRVTVERTGSPPELAGL